MGSSDDIFCFVINPSIHAQNNCMEVENKDGTSNYEFLVY